MFFVKKNVNLRVPDKLHSGWWQAAFARVPRLQGWRSSPLSMSAAKWLHQGPLLDHHSLAERARFPAPALQSLLERRSSAFLPRRCVSQGVALPSLAHHVLPPPSLRFRAHRATPTRGWAPATSGCAGSCVSTHPPAQESPHSSFYWLLLFWLCWVFVAALREFSSQSMGSLVLHAGSVAPRHVAS